MAGDTAGSGVGWVVVGYTPGEGEYPCGGGGGYPCGGVDTLVVVGDTLVVEHGGWWWGIPLGLQVSTN